MNKIDVTAYIGFRSGMLEVIAEGEPHVKGSGQKQTTFICRCDCGNVKQIHSQNIKTGKSKSCGCVKKAIIAEVNKSHGLTNTPEFKAWISMRQRCSEKAGKETKKHYFTKGITICDRWQNSFENFLSDMGNMPNDATRYTIERINSNLNYEPSNCRWATYKEQANNTSNNRIIEYNGMALTMKQWAEKLGINYQTLSNRINKLKWTIQEALSNGN